MPESTGGKGAPGRVPAEPRLIRRASVVAFLAVAAFISALVVSKVVFPFFSGDHDEPVYIFGAKMLLGGKVTLSAAAQASFFRPWLSGIHGGRIFLPYQPGFSALLAASDGVFGTPRVALGLIAAASVVACFAFAFELFQARRRAIIAAALFAFAPVFVIQSALYLAYNFTTLWLLVFATLALRGLRTSSRLSFALAGVALGCAFLARPNDAVIFCLPVVVFAVFTRRRESDALARAAVWVGVGMSPLMLVTLLYNAHLTGAPFQFPHTAAVREGGLGFGTRRIVTGAPAVKYSVGDAWHALNGNLRWVPPWLFGGVIGVVLAAWGLVRDRRRPEAWLLAGIIVAFPAAYFFWWGTKLSSGGAQGIGPHYYIPIFAPLAILAAGPILYLWERQRLIAIAVLTAMVVVTAVGLPARFDGNLSVRDASRRVNQTVERRHLHDALVFLPRENDPKAGNQYLLQTYPYFMNEPDLTGPIVYAIDRGGEDVGLLQQLPRRKPYRLGREVQPGGNLFRPSLLLTPLTTVRGKTMVVRARVRVPDFKSVVATYIRANRSFVPPRSITATLDQHVLDMASHPGATYEVEWTLRPSDLPGPAGAVGLPGRSGTLALGVAFGDASSHDDSGRLLQDSKTSIVEVQYDYLVTNNDGLVVVTPPVAEARLAIKKIVWVYANVSDQVTACVAPESVVCEPPALGPLPGVSPVARRHR